MSTLAKTLALVLVTVIFTSGCSTLPAGPDRDGDGASVVAGAPVCDDLAAADDMRAIVATSSSLEITQARFDSEGTLWDVSCTVAADDDRRLISVKLSMNVKPCEPADQLDVDPEYPEGRYGTATNGGLGYWLCLEDGNTALATYISTVDAPGPTVAQLREILLATVAELDLLREIAAGTVEEPEPTADGCGEFPSELVAAGITVDGCVLESFGNDNGGTTVRIQADDGSMFDSVSDALARAGLETVFCEESPRFCGWSGEAGNANVTYEPPVLELETWGF